MAPPGNKTHHHCPKCKGIASPRCTHKGHMERCEVHGAHHSTRSECVQCKDAREREAKAERDRRLEEKAAEEKERRGSMDSGFSWGGGKDRNKSKDKGVRRSMESGRSLAKGSGGNNKSKDKEARGSMDSGMSFASGRSGRSLAKERRKPNKLTKNRKPKEK